MTKPTCIWDTRNPAFEIKFPVSLSAAAGIREWARGVLRPDPHGFGPHEDDYLITSIYFDTGDFDVFHRRGSYRRSKYRIRRYGTGDAVFLERKLRTRKVISKRRTPVDCEDLMRFSGRSVSSHWADGWFWERLRLRRLSPVSQISYRRTARFTITSIGMIRLTVDEDLRALPTADLVFQPGRGDLVAGDQAIVELKFRIAMPAIFKQMVEKFAIEPRRVSKYRLAATFLGLVPTPPDALGAASKTGAHICQHF